MRQVIVVLINEQKTVTVEGNIETIKDLRELLTEHVNNPSDYRFMERTTRASYEDDNAVLPKEVTKKDGTITPNLLVSASLKNMKFENGALSKERQDAYICVKELKLQEEIKATYGKNYTLVSTEDIMKVVNSHKEKEVVLGEANEGRFEIISYLKDIKDLLQKFIKGTPSITPSKTSSASYSEEEIKELMKN